MTRTVGTGRGTGKVCGYGASGCKETGLLDFAHRMKSRHKRFALHHRRRKCGRSLRPSVPQFHSQAQEIKRPAHPAPNLTRNMSGWRPGKPIAARTGAHPAVAQGTSSRSPKGVRRQLRSPLQPSSSTRLITLNESQHHASRECESLRVR